MSKCYMSALILIESPDSGTVASSDSQPKKYAVLPAKREGCIDALFLENGIEILRDDEFTLPESSKLKALELVMEFSTAEGALVYFIVDEANKTLPEQLLSKRPNVWDSQTNNLIADVAYDVVYDLICTLFAIEEENNLRVLEKLLAAKVEITLIHDDGGSLLHLAADQGSHGERLIALLCEHGANVNVMRQDGATPLHLAAATKYNDDEGLRSVEILLENGACIDAKTQDGFTPLHEAAMKGWLSVVKLLLEHGAEVDAKATYDWTPLYVAVNAGWLEVAQLLVERGADLTAKTVDGRTLLHVAASPQKTYLYVPLVKWLFQNGVDINATNVRGNTALHNSAQEDPHVLKLLLERGADINVENDDGETPLLIAVTYNHLASYQCLMSLNPDFTIQGNRDAFYMALSRDTQSSVELVEQMAQQGFKVVPEDALNPDIFFNAISKRLVGIVRCLLEYGADVNQHHTFALLKMTPLHYAIRTHQREIVRLLLDFGANVYAQCGQRTPITEAVEFAGVEMIIMLVGRGVRVRDTPTLLHLAVKRGNSEVIAFLIDNGFDCSRQNSKRETPLSMVAQQSNVEALKVMVSFGIQVDYCNLVGIKACNPAFLSEFLNNSFNLPAPAALTVIKQLFATKFSGSAESSCVKILAEHLIKLEAVHDNFCTMSFSFHRVFLGLDDFKDRCKVEAAAMKLEKVGCADLTFLDILKMNSRQIARCARDGCVFEFLKSWDFKSKCPIYGSILTAKCRFGCMQRLRLNQGIKTLKVLCPQFSSLPGELKEIVVDFLSDQDLIILQKSVSNKVM